MPGPNRTGTFPGGRRWRSEWRAFPYRLNLADLYDVPVVAWEFHHGDALDVYPEWDPPDLIVSDGAYGVSGFAGDLPDTDGLSDWYEPHIASWSAAASPRTSLWFWNTEVGWATVHPTLIAHGWEYVQLVTWDKGIAHIAGNVNGDTIRRFPVVTEVSALYRRKPVLAGVDDVAVPAQMWFRSEWQRSGLPMKLANVACGVKEAASRKYLASDQWYFPPGEMVEAMSAYLNVHGRPDGRPYMPDADGSPMTASAWGKYRAVWNHEHGLTNVWAHPPLNGPERVRNSAGGAAHPNQKPLEFAQRQVRACTGPGDVVWEPFGGLATFSVAAVALGRRPYAAETDPETHRLGSCRLRRASEAPCGHTQQSMF